jgi:protocatechuate 3,4-dioxygenase beta subunit
MWFGLVWIALVSAWAQDAGVIEGSVGNAASHAPLPAVQVVVTRSGSTPGAEYRGVSDVEGKYRIEGLPAGEYTARFEAEGYVTANSRELKVAAGATVRLSTELWARATLSGRVLDDQGRPAAKLAVELHRYRGGQPVKTTTDEEGRYTFGGVSPGVYAIAARPPQKVVDGGTLAPVWFPSSTERSEAERIIARAGVEQSGLDLRLRRVPVWSVQGVAADEEGRPVGGVSVRLRVPDEWQADEAVVVSGAGGVFEFAAVRPGEWRLAASGAGREGYASVIVDKHDVERVALKLFPPFTLDGFIEREEPRDAEGKRKLTGVYLTPVQGQGRQASAFHQQDGAIRIPKVQPGRYVIFPVGYVPGYFVESVWLGEREVMAKPVDLSDGALRFRVIYRGNAGRVRGTVEKGGGSTVALLPQDEALLDGQFIRTAKCDSNGRFEVGSLRPGEYYAFAFDRVDNYALTDAAFVRNLRAAAVAVHVEAARAADVELKVTEWPE